MQALFTISDGVYREIYKGIEKEHLAIDLRPGTLYKVRVSCTSRGGTSPVSIQATNFPMFLLVFALDSVT